VIACVGHGVDCHTNEVESVIESLANVVRGVPLIDIDPRQSFFAVCEWTLADSLSVQNTDRPNRHDREQSCR